jgi:DNA-binding Lrp family transcriptional regulator
MCIKAAIIKLKTYIVFKNAFVPSVYSRDLVIQWLAEIQQEKLDEMDDETMKGTYPELGIINCVDECYRLSGYRASYFLCKCSYSTDFVLKMSVDNPHRLCLPRRTD